VLFLGVGPLTDFRYAEIREFGRRVLKIALSTAERPHHICSPVHGPGYGLDENEAFLSLIGGFSDAINIDNLGKPLEAITIVERDTRRAEYFSALLMQNLFGEREGNERETKARPKNRVRPESFDKQATVNLSGYGRDSKLKTRLFVAMPFAKMYSDEWEISITEAAGASDVICERLDEESYVGDVLGQIKKRISEYDGLIALLNDSNPNVFLELGFAWAKDKPTILIVKEGGQLPFDVKGQRCLMYSNIADLRKKLTNELANLKKIGVFAQK
jgi:hypothetical protein